jgi:glycosyltransferase involved in cell wall biosynthesis
MSDVSVALATYNGARHLREQVESILGQTEPPAEIVICDDGSTDDTIRILRDLADESDVPIHIHRNERRLGFSDNFLKAARLTKGRYIAFSDQDDRWEPGKLERSRRALRVHDAVMCTHQVMLMTEEGSPLRLDPQMISTSTVVEAMTTEPFGLYFGFTMTIDRRLLDLIPGSRKGLDNFTTTEVLPHDRWVYFLATNFGRSVALAEPLAHYRQHRSQAYGVRPVSLLQRFRNKVDEGPVKLAFLATLAQKRAALIEEYQPEVCTDGGRRVEWRQVHDRWRRVADFYWHRRDLYLASPFLLRAGKLASNAGRGMYRTVPKGGLGPKRFLEDVSLGLFGRVAGRW